MSPRLDVEYIEIRNFLSYGDYVTKLEVANLGPVLILGKIDSDEAGMSNGAGKSSLLSAFIWCLFGRSIINPSPGDKVINWHVGKNCYVKLKTADGWEIIRTRGCDNHSELLIQKDGDDQTKSTNQNAQKKLEELFGLDYDIFISSVFCGQFGKSFLEMTPIKRKETIERLLGLDKLNQYADMAKAKSTQAEQEQEVARARIDLYKADIERQQSRIKEGFKSKYSFEAQREERKSAIKSKIKELIESVQSIEAPDLKKLEEKWRLVNSINKKLEEYQTLIKENQLEINLLDNAISRAEATFSRIEAPQSVPNLPDLETRHKFFDAASKKLRELRDTASKLKTDVLIKDKEKASLEAVIERWENKTNSQCESCGQEISPSHTEIKISSFSKLLEKAELERNLSSSQLSKLEAAMRTLEAVEAPSMSLEEAKRILDFSAKREEEVSLLKNQLLQDKTKKQNLLSATDDLKLMVAQTAGKLIKLKPAITLEHANQLHFRLCSLRERESELNNQLNRIDQEINPYLKIIADLEEGLKAVNLELQDQEDIIKQLDILYSHYRYIYKSYSDRTKIKSWMLSELIPFLNDRVHYYLDKLGVEIAVTFNSTLGTETDKWDYDFCSGGERKRIDLAIMFGLYDLYVSLYGQQCNIMVLDEVDSRLDPRGVESFADIVNDICTNDERPKPSTVFVISHKQELESMFPSQITIRKTGDFSVIDQTVFSADQK